MSDLLIWINGLSAGAFLTAFGLSIAALQRNTRKGDQR